MTAFRAQRPLEEHWLSDGQDHSSEQVEPWYVALQEQTAVEVLALKTQAPLPLQSLRGVQSGVWHTPLESRYWLEAHTGRQLPVVVWPVRTSSTEGLGQEVQSVASGPAQPRQEASQM